jgi:SAM-dependent methyltransferase
MPATVPCGLLSDRLTQGVVEQARPVAPLIGTFDDFRRVVAAYRLPRIIFTALDLDLFTALGSGSWTVPELAKKLRASPRGVDILCRNLACAGLLEKRGSRYRNSPFARRELNRTSPAYRSAYLDLIRGQWDAWSKLTQAVQSGRPVEDQDDPDDPVYRRRFTWAMHERSRDIAPKIAAQIDLRGARTLLDLGGGPGTYALAFLEQNPDLHATVCDRAPALEVAREIAASFPHGRRLSYLPLDFIQQPIPGRYDVIWLSNVLHIYSPEENLQLFRKIAKALEPGGRLLIQDAFVHEEKNGSLDSEATLFAVTMLLFTERGNTYTVRDTAGWLKRAGFARVRPVKLKAGTEDWTGGILEASLRRSPLRRLVRNRR